MRKKRIAFFLIALNLVIFSNFIARAADPLLIVTVGAFNETGQLEVTVSLRDNPGISGLKLRLEYDRSILTPVSLAKGSAFPFLKSNLDEQNLQYEDISQMTFITAQWGEASNVADSGDLFTVLFQLRSDLPVEGGTDFTLKYNTGAIVNQDGIPISPRLENVTLSWGTADAAGTSAANPPAEEIPSSQPEPAPAEPAAEPGQAELAYTAQAGEDAPAEPAAAAGSAQEEQGTHENPKTYDAGGALTLLATFAAIGVIAAAAYIRHGSVMALKRRRRR